MENHFFIKEIKIDEYEENSPQNCLLITESSNPLYGSGAKSWDSSICLAKALYYLNEEKIYSFKNKTVLQLGCGVGLISIYLGTIGAFVYATDLPMITELIEKNIENNKNVTKNRVKFFPFNWSDHKIFQDKQSPLNNQINYIVASQPFTNPETFQVFMKCIKILLNKNKFCKLFLSFKLKDNDLSRFETKLDDFGLQGERLGNDSMHPDFIDDRVIIYCIQN